MTGLKDCLFCAALGLAITILAAAGLSAVTWITGVGFYTVALFAVAGTGMAIGVLVAAEMYVERRIRQQITVEPTSEQVGRIV